MREESGRRLVGELADRDSDLHVDPVFLLDSEDWSELARTRILIITSLSYRLNKSNVINDFARKLAHLTGKKIVNIGQDFIDKLKNRDFDG